MLERVKEILGVTTPYPKNKAYVRKLNHRLLQGQYMKSWRLPEYVTLLEAIMKLPEENEVRKIFLLYLSDIAADTTTVSQLISMCKLYSRSSIPDISLQIFGKILGATRQDHIFRNFTYSQYLHEYRRIIVDWIIDEIKSRSDSYSLMR